MKRGWNIIKESDDYRLNIIKENGDLEFWEILEYKNGDYELAM
ncbi:hypothetical protein Leryth_017991, partial [Lithospermum erythrorhizon]